MSSRSSRIILTLCLLSNVGDGIRPFKFGKLRFPLKLLSLRERLTENVMVNRCYLCMSAVESCNHILLWCPTAYNLWCMIYELLRINQVMAGLVRDETWAWSGLYKKSDFVKIIPLIIFWILLERKKYQIFWNRDIER